MALDVASLTKDKRVLAAAGVGGALGLVALVRKRGQGSSSPSGSASTTSTSTPSTYSPGSLGSYDSSATDAYNNFNNELNGRLDEFGKSITDVQAQLNALKPTGGTQSGSGGQKPADPRYYRPLKGDNWNTIAAKYYPSLPQAQALAQLRSLNGGKLPALAVGSGVRVA